MPPVASKYLHPFRNSRLFTSGWTDVHHIGERHIYRKSSLRPPKNTGCDVTVNHHTKNRETCFTLGQPERVCLCSSVDTS
jgi:hypothetical protein